MRAVLIVVAVAALTQGCALRPRYRDFVAQRADVKQVQLLVTDGTGQPLPNVKIELSEWKNRLLLTSGPDGVVTLPVDKKYLDENPVLVLQLPSGVSSYTLALAPPPLPPALPPPAAEPAVAEPPAVPVPAAPPAPTPAPAASGTTP